MTAIVYLTDKSGKKMFTDICGASFIDSAKRGIQKHLDNAKKNPDLYSFIDLDTCEIKVEYKK